MSELLKENVGSSVIPFPVDAEQFEANRSRPMFTGPLSGPMWSKVADLGSKYPDSFDWEIYDKLFERFGESQPRGGVTFKTTLKVANYNVACSKCHYALEIDTYGRGCLHNCVYCYAKDQLTLKGYWNRPFPMPIDLAEVRKIFYTVFETSKANKWRNILEMRIPIRIGSMSDSFMWMDKKYGVTREFLKILKWYRYPYVVFTRSDLIADNDYIELLDPDLCSVQFSIAGDNEKLTKVIEPGAPSVARRLKAIKLLKDASIWTAVRINPLFPTYPDGYFTDQEGLQSRFSSASEIPKLDLLDIENCETFFDSLKETGVNTLIAGFVRLNQTSISQLSRATNINIRNFFAPERYTNSGESHYSDAEIAYYYKTLHMKAIRRGMRFSTCYIGNGMKDYYQYQKLWNNKKDCCDVVGNVSAFKKTSQNIPWEVREKCATSKESAAQLKQVEKEFDENQILSDQGFDKLNEKLSQVRAKGLTWDVQKQID
jgi:DNA repair photolyase